VLISGILPSNRNGDGGRRCHCIAWQNPHMRIGWLDNFERAMSLRNCPHLPTTQGQYACADFGDFAKQRNGDSGREKDLNKAKEAYSSLKFSGSLGKNRQVKFDH
jgi:hypothetical protein